MLREVVHQMTDQVLAVPLFGYVQPSLISNRLRGVIPGSTFNVQDWDVSS